MNQWPTAERQRVLRRIATDCSAQSAGYVKHRHLQGIAVADRSADFLPQGRCHFFAATMIFHGRRIFLRIPDHRPSGNITVNLVHEACPSRLQRLSTAA